jgi:hypothetical protein
MTQEILGDRRKKKKVTLVVRISPEVDKEFRRFVALKYQRYEYGLLGFEVEEAMKNQIRSYMMQINKFNNKGEEWYKIDDD